MQFNCRPTWARYASALASLVLVTVARMLLDPWLGSTHAYTFYLVAVAFSVWYGGTGPGLLTLAMGTIAADWFFLEPRYSLGLQDHQHWVAYAVFTVTGLVILYFSRSSHTAYQQEWARQLFEANRRKDEFLAMLGHELRNPLAGILNGAEVLRMVEGKSPEAAEMQEVIEREARHMGRLIDDLLDLSRICRGKITLRHERLDLVAVVKDTVENYRCRIEKAHLHLVFNASDSPVWVTGDRTRLSQIVGNLLSNAQKFTDAQGRVTVRVGTDSQARMGTIVVEDTGIGMEREVLHQVFEPFTQADTSLDRSRGGLGLGLALVKGIVDLHGGEVTARSRGLGQGSEFLVRLPLAAAPSDCERPGKEEEPSWSKYRVLVIDDRRDAILPLKKMLTLMGHEVASAMSGREGLELAYRLRPDLILCDIGLPEMDGYEVARALRASPDCGSTYLVAITGYGQEEDRRRAAVAGFDYHLAKPVSKVQLVDLLSRFPRFEAVETIPGSRSA